MISVMFLHLPLTSNFVGAYCFLPTSSLMLFVLATIAPLESTKLYAPSFHLPFDFSFVLVPSVLLWRDTETLCCWRSTYGAISGTHRSAGAF